MIPSSASVALGLIMSGKLKRGGGPDRRAYHEILSLSVMVAIAVHGLSLIGDGFLHPSLFATTLGIVAGWGMICLGLSYYVRDRIARRVEGDPPAHGAGLDRRAGSHLHGGHRRGAGLVHRADRHHGRPGGGAPGRPAGRLHARLRGPVDRGSRDTPGDRRAQP
jgi:hypothetical protein